MTGIAAKAAALDAALNRFVTQGGLPGAAAGSFTVTSLPGRPARDLLTRARR